MAKETRIQFRVSEEKKRRIEKCAAIAGLDLTTLGEKAIEALCDYIEEHHEITTPFVLVPKSAIRKGQVQVSSQRKGHTEDRLQVSAQPKVRAEEESPPGRARPKKGEGTRSR